MKIITVEEHFESEKVSLAMSPYQPALPPVSDEMKHYMQTALPSPATMQDVMVQRLHFMDTNGIDMQILSYGNASPQNLDPKVSVALARMANEELAKAVALAPNRFAALAVLPVGDPEAAASELERAVKDLNFKGVLLKGNFEGRFFDDPFFFPIFQKAADLDVPVYFHPSFVPPVITKHYFDGDQWPEVISGIIGSAGYGWHMDVGIQVMRLILTGVLEKLPNLKLISGHWGEMVPMFLERLDDETTAYSGLSKPFSSYYRDQVYLSPSGMLTKPQLNFILEEMGSDHILYSIDYPYKQPKNAGTFLTDSGLSIEQQNQIAWQNATKLLHL